MSKSFWFAFVLVAAVVLAIPTPGKAACPSPAMTPAVAADSLPLVLLPPVSLAKAGPTPSSEWECCDGAYEECEWRCTQGIKTYWCDANGCGPGCCAVQCDCWIWE